MCIFFFIGEVIWKNPYDISSLPKCFAVTFYKNFSEAVCVDLIYYGFVHVKASLFCILILNVRDLRFLHWRCWGFKWCGMYRPCSSDVGCTDRVQVTWDVQTVFKWHGMYRPCSSDVGCTDHVQVTWDVQTVFKWRGMYRPCSIDVGCTDRVQ